MMQFDTIISIYVRHALTFFDVFMKMEGQKGKCKDDIKSYSLDRFEQVERSKIFSEETRLALSRALLLGGHGSNLVIVELGKS